MIRCFRTVLPKGLELLAVTVIVAVLASILAIRWISQSRTPVSDEAMLLVFGSLAAAYAFYRFAAFHPAFRQEYREWLATTPWTPKRPLPFGPLHIVWQDVAIVGAWSAIAWFWFQSVYFLAVPVVAITVYLGGIAVAHFKNGQWTPAWVATFGIALALRFIEVPAVSAVGLVVLYFVLRRSLLAGYPWDHNPFSALTVDELGWPFDALAPGALRSFPWPGKRLSVIIACLAGSAAHAFTLTTADPNLRIGKFEAIALHFSLGALALIRVCAYVLHHWPPISVAGRLRLGKLIIPAYDQVFVGPLVGVTAGESLFAVMQVLGAPLTIAQPTALAVGVWLIIVIGPSPTRWTLTGNHRHVSLGIGTKVARVG